MEVWAVVFLVIEHKAVNTDQEIKGFERNTASEAQKISSYVSFLFFFSFHYTTLHLFPVFQNFILMSMPFFTPAPLQFFIATVPLSSKLNDSIVLMTQWFCLVPYFSHYHVLRYLRSVVYVQHHSGTAGCLLYI